jgi:hypothetical protein
MVLGVKTTLDIADALFRQAKQRAAGEGLTLRALVERALRAYLASPATSAGYRFQWYPQSGAGPVPWEVFRSRGALQEFLGEDEAELYR